MKFAVGANIIASGPSPMDVARLAEQLGYESMFMGEHIFVPVESQAMRRGAPMPERYRHMPDPIIWLTAAAAVTTKLKFGFCILLVPQRHPLILAKELACMDQISRGRVILGAGAGWNADDAAIMGYPFEKRWARTMESLRAMKKLWTEDGASFSGEHISFPKVYCNPKPVQTPHIPILIGAGNPESNNIYAMRRVVELGSGWLPALMSPAQIAKELTTLRELCAAAGRDFKSLDITLVVPGVTLGIGSKFDAMGKMDVVQRDPQDVVAEYEAAGVTRIIVGFDDLTIETGLQTIEAAAKKLKLA